MDEQRVILRRWSSRIRSSDEAAYVRYVEATGIRDYRATVGNLGCQMLLRALPDGSTEVTTLSWWQSLEAIEAFAGTPIDIARYYPEDDAFLLEKPQSVEHHRVAAGEMAL
jgi:heme-degrading monooxygenase HmoA